MSTNIRRACITVALAMIALALWYCLYPRLNAPARVGWKNHAMEAIRAECNMAGDVRFVALPSPNTSLQGTSTDLPWMTGTRITMANGESVVFRNICQKEDFRIRDLFICKASDGHWYFSTFHFCVGMTVFRYAAAMDGQPASIQAFVQQYALKPFDPESNQCLSTTWPGASMANL